MSISSKNQKSISGLLNDRIEQAIDAKKHQIREVLKEVENTTKASFQAHVDYHKYLMEEAKQKGDIAVAIHHKVLMETYEGILRNFTMSNAYDKV